MDPAAQASAQLGQADTVRDADNGGVSPAQLKLYNLLRFPSLPLLPDPVCYAPTDTSYSTFCKTKYIIWSIIYKQHFGLQVCFADNAEVVLGGAVCWHCVHHAAAALHHDQWPWKLSCHCGHGQASLIITIPDPVLGNLYSVSPHCRLQSVCLS